ncbi:ATP-binding protein [Nocardioides sp. HM23]|uniref:ATP-binding protein n=1 Tax=Nocardioides bizhenqiangii TaxID=3095076 RepID=UPI002ACABF77|nr:ATP-binding protein [Nocardioides sp. HM23]MDZ5622053.1 ATP-binding protein [Nocardioides sp. HM23]
MADAPGVESFVVQGEPTKDFFISMLVRDIGLIPAIVDLVDNSVDGARRLRPADDPAREEDERFTGLFVSLRVTAESFEITDNCGGITWETARSYAFRFGRPTEAPATPGSIGQFGIGMKRALFKLGNAFTVRSVTEKEDFELRVNVPEWSESKEWNFSNVTYRPDAHDSDEVGTTITVTSLHPAVSESFSLKRFESELSDELSMRHQASMSDGLAVSLNGIPVDVDVLTLLTSEELKPGYFSDALDKESDTPVHVSMYTGVSASSPTDAGWYVYCNGRLILGPDRTSVTGWGTARGVPQYHNQYARFRGYLFFESASVDKLPWTTTKEGVDSGHWAYRALKTRMVDAMRPVMAFLNALDAEKDNPAAGKESLESYVSAAESSPSTLTQITTTTAFTSPQRPKAPKAPETQSIQFVRPKKQIDAIKKKLKVSSAGKVGEGTFDYFYKRECADDE